MKTIKNQKFISDLAVKRLNNYRTKNAGSSLVYVGEKTKYKRNAAVLLLLGYGSKGELDIIFTKRSNTISQPNDLCCPGGLSSYKIDSFFAKTLMLQGTFLTKWPYWWRLKTEEKENFAFFLSTALRESFEEIKLNLFGIKLIGALPTQYFKIANNEVNPFVCVTKQQNFFLNSEVDRIVRIPISTFLVKKNYLTYHPESVADLLNNKVYSTINFPCFVHCQNKTREILWGLTYKITMTFLQTVFDFHKYGII